MISTNKNININLLGEFSRCDGAFSSKAKTALFVSNEN